MGGHAGVERTLERISALFWWKQMREDIRNFVANCLICQQMKLANHKKMELLMALPIPPNVWHDVSMDFITHLPKINGKSVILVVEHYQVTLML